MEFLRVTLALQEGKHLWSVVMPEGLLLLHVKNSWEHFHNPERRVLLVGRIRSTWAMGIVGAVASGWRPAETSMWHQCLEQPVLLQEPPAEFSHLNQLQRPPGASIQIVSTLSPPLAGRVRGTLVQRAYCRR